VGYLVLKGKKKRPGSAASSEAWGAFTDPPENYAMMPAAMRQILIVRNGPDGVVNRIHILPITKFSDMDQQVSFWIRRAQMADAKTEDTHSEITNKLSELAGLPTIAGNLAKSLVALRLKILDRLNQQLVGAHKTPLSLNPFLYDSFVGIGNAYTKQGGLLPIASPLETKEFWLAVDKVAIDVQARLFRLSGQPSEWSSYLAAIKSSTLEFYNSQKAASKVLAETLGKAAAEVTKMGGNMVGSFFGGLGITNTVLLVAAALGGTYLYFKVR